MRFNQARALRQRMEDARSVRENRRNMVEWMKRELYGWMQYRAGYCAGENVEGVVDALDAADETERIENAGQALAFYFKHAKFPPHDKRTTRERWEDFYREYRLRPHTMGDFKRRAFLFACDPWS